MYKLLTNYLRATFYSLTVVLGLAVAANELDGGHPLNFWRMIALTYVIFLIDIYTAWDWRRGRIQTGIGAGVEQGWKSALLHHLVIPAATFFGIAGFIYFNSQEHLRAGILFFSLITFVVLLTHIRAYYREQVQLAQSTHYVYDMAKILIYFTLSNALFNLAQIWQSPVLPALLLGLLTLILFMMMLSRYEKAETKVVLFSGLCGIVALVLSLACSLFLQLNPLQIGFVMVLCYYLANALLYHLMENDLTWQIVGEYILVMLIAVSVIVATS